MVKTDESWIVQLSILGLDFRLNFKNAVSVRRIWALHLEQLQRELSQRRDALIKVNRQL